MNKLLSLAMPALLTFSLLAISPPILAQPQTLSAQQILDAVAQKYAGFQNYEGTCSILIEGESSAEGDTTQIASSANSTTIFERGKSLEVTGDSGFGGKFEANSTPTETTIKLFSEYGKELDLPMVFDRDAGISMEFLAGLTGLSGGGGATLPIFLTSKDGDLNPLHWKGVVALLPMQNLGTKPCYVVTKTNDENKTVETFWIEKGSFLLRRMETLIGEGQAPTMTEEDMEKYPQLRDMPAITTHYGKHTLVFNTQVAK